MMVGCSGYTHDKWDRFEQLLDIHVRICRETIQKHEWYSSIYHYFDFYAGPGRYTAEDHPDLDGESGSPIRAIEILCNACFDAAGDLDCQCWLFDKNHSSRLKAAVSSTETHLSHVFGLSIDEAVDYLNHPRWDTLARDVPQSSCSRGRVDGPFLGLAFFDPNGLPDWASIRRFASSKAFERIDLLINVNSTVHKRVVASPLHHGSRPTEHLRELGKKFIYLWEPTPGDRHQFALAYCTNGPFSEIRRKGFYLLDTDKGGLVARRIDRTARERREQGGSTGFMTFMED